MKKQFAKIYYWVIALAIGYTLFFYLFAYGFSKNSTNQNNWTIETVRQKLDSLINETANFWQTKGSDPPFAKFIQTEIYFCYAKGQEIRNFSSNENKKIGLCLFDQNNFDFNYFALTNKQIPYFYSYQHQTIFLEKSFLSFRWQIALFSHEARHAFNDLNNLDQNLTYLEKELPIWQEELFLLDNLTNGEIRKTIKIILEKKLYFKNSKGIFFLSPNSENLFNFALGIPNSIEEKNYFDSLKIIFLGLEFYSDKKKKTDYLKKFYQ